MVEANPEPVEPVEPVELTEEEANKKATLDEFNRRKAVMVPLIEDYEAQEADLNEEEREAYENFERTLRVPEEDGGDDARDAFTKEIDDAFAEANAESNGDGLLTAPQLKQFIETMNNHAVTAGLKGRETSQEWVDMAFPIFDAMKTDVQGVDKEDLLFVLGQCCM